MPGHKTHVTEGIQALRPLDELFEVRDSGVDGIGTFAKIDMPKWYIIGNVRGRKEGPDYTSRTCTYHPDGGCIEPDNTGVPVHTMNHSCAANCAMADDFDEVGGVIVYTERAIAAGEELTIDYQWELDWEPLPCHCGAPQCRGWIVNEEAATRINTPPPVVAWDTYLALRPSEIAGLGLFSRIPIAEAQPLGEVTGVIFRDSQSDQNSIDLGDFGWLHPTGGVPTWMINHACEENLEAVLYLYEEIPRLVIRAKVDIPADVEVTLDYGRFRPNPCRCPKHGQENQEAQEVPAADRHSTQSADGDYAAVEGTDIAVPVV